MLVRDLAPLRTEINVHMAGNAAARHDFIQLKPLIFCALI